MKEKFDSLSGREKIAVFSAIFFISATLFWLFIYTPAVESKALLIRKIEKSEKKLAETKALARELVKIRKEIELFTARISPGQNSTSPLSRIEQTALSSGIRDKITSMSPSPAIESDGFSEVVVNVSMEQVTLASFARFVAMLTKGGALSVKRVSISPEYADPSLLSVSIALSFFEVSGA